MAAGAGSQTKSAAKVQGQTIKVKTELVEVRAVVTRIYDSSSASSPDSGTVHLSSKQTKQPRRARSLGFVPSVAAIH